jgi:hypothetical protein
MVLPVLHLALPPAAMWAGRALLGSASSLRRHQRGLEPDQESSCIAHSVRQHAGNSTVTSSVPSRLTVPNSTVTSSVPSQSTGYGTGACKPQTGRSQLVLELLSHL